METLVIPYNNQRQRITYQSFTQTKRVILPSTRHTLLVVHHRESSLCQFALISLGFARAFDAYRILEVYIISHTHTLER